MINRDHAYRMLAWRLKQAGIESSSLDARVLVQAACRASDIEMIREPGVMLTPDEEKLLADYEARRLAHEPVSRIVGRREFWGLEFEVTDATLDPRADSETLIEAALDLLRDVKSPRLLDIGTGTGCLLLALLHERQDASGIGVDVSPDTLKVAERNAARLDLALRAGFTEGVWCGGLDMRFDLVISNPPYIERDTIGSLAPEVCLHDPVLALDGGVDGLDAYRALVAEIPDVLVPGGVAVIELGAGQADAVAALFELAGFTAISTKKDLAGIDRALVARMQRAAGEQG